MADAAALTELWLSSRRGAVGIPPPVHDEEEVAAWLRRLLQAATHEVWVSIEDDRPVGLIAIEGDCVEQLYVAPDRQRRGHGSRLLEVAMAGHDSLGLWTFEANAGARAFYEAHGFRAVGEPSSENEEGEPARRYRWKR